MKRIMLILACVAMSGCLTVSYRRGASGEAMSADEKACRETTETDAAYRECLEARGTWVLDTSGAASIPAGGLAPTDSASAPAQTSTADTAESSGDESGAAGFGTLPPDERDSGAQPPIGPF